ncbi:hypothetical protein EMEDMD4_1070007 [Sinorhizobium medicae]|uniref:Uncharacterized protein n=1 Tax=Sinorhizobium medicae TaxID=110321 RepID=A0A508WUP6_9HYPH|nr:hypothetical protein EMEDMD4_1070007 [Sinorhizobium medicae]
MSSRTASKRRRPILLPGTSVRTATSSSQSPFMHSEACRTSSRDGLLCVRGFDTSLAVQILAKLGRIGGVTITGLFRRQIVPLSSAGCVPPGQARRSQPRFPATISVLAQ